MKKCAEIYFSSAGPSVQMSIYTVRSVIIFVNTKQ